MKAEDTFQGWYTADGTAWDFDAPVERNLTLYAYWLNDSYAEMVLYLDGVNGDDQNDGLTPETALKTFSKAQAVMPAKVRDGISYIVDTVTISGTETWDMAGKDCVVMRWSDCLTDMIDVTSGQLTLANIIIDGKGDSGSQMLYALKIFYGADTQIPEEIALEALNDAIRINFPHKKGLFVGMYRKVINKEDNVTSDKRATNQV